MRNVLIAISLLSLPACGAQTSQVPSDEAQGLLAMGPSTCDVPAAEPRTPARFSEEALRDPAERFRLIERLRIEVVSKTRQLPETRWWGEVRPALHRQLSCAGLAPADVDFLLREVDQAKADVRRG
jgi:hypothetical protein